jgi:hypothetical protein
VSLALLLSMLSVFSITEAPALEWLGWFGWFGGLVSILVIRLGGFKMAIAGLLIGFGANVVFLATVFLGASRLLSRLSRRVTA